MSLNIAKLHEDLQSISNIIIIIIIIIGTHNNADSTPGFINYCWPMCICVCDPSPKYQRILYTSKINMTGSLFQKFFRQSHLLLFFAWHYLKKRSSFQKEDTPEKKTVEWISQNKFVWKTLGMNSLSC